MYRLVETLCIFVFGVKYWIQMSELSFVNQNSA